MTKTKPERLAVVETKLDVVLEEIRTMNEKLDKLDVKFAAKWVQTVMGGFIGLILSSFVVALWAMVIRG